MSNKFSQQDFKTSNLAPFQADFISRFLSAESPQGVNLVIPSGAGKSKIASNIISALLEQKSKTFLILANNISLLIQYKEQIHLLNPNSDPRIITRLNYLELLEETPNKKNPLAFSGIVLMETGSCKSERIMSSILEMNWDFLFCDGVNQVGKKLLSNLISSKNWKRALFFTSLQLPYKINSPRVSHEQIDLETALGTDDQKFISQFSRINRLIEYKLNGKEKAFFVRYDRTISRIENSTNSILSKAFPQVLRRSISSSPLQATNVLSLLLNLIRPLRNRLAHGMDINVGDLSEIIGSLLDFQKSEPPHPQNPEKAINPNDLLHLFRDLEILLNESLDLVWDSKLQALISYLKEIKGSKQPFHVWIRTSYLSTADYLFTALEEEKTKENLFLVNGKQLPEKRKSTLMEFKKLGGILVSTDALLVGTDLRFVSHMVNYDFNPESLGLIQSISGICSNVDIQQITFFKNDIEHSSPAASILKEFNLSNL